MQLQHLINDAWANRELLKEREKLLKKIEDLRKRKINSLKEVKNSKNYLKTLAVRFPNI